MDSVSGLVSPLIFYLCLFIEFRLFDVFETFFLFDYHDEFRDSRLLSQRVVICCQYVCICICFSVEFYLYKPIRLLYLLFAARVNLFIFLILSYFV